MRNVGQVFGFAADASPEDRETVEPNANIACNWWPDVTNVWTPIGWPNHLFRFNVVYDGANHRPSGFESRGPVETARQTLRRSGSPTHLHTSPSPYLGLGAINLSLHMDTQKRRSPMPAERPKSASRTGMKRRLRFCGASGSVKGWCCAKKCLPTLPAVDR